MKIDIGTKMKGLKPKMKRIKGIMDLFDHIDIDSYMSRYIIK